jgi:hypothetical protein
MDSTGATLQTTKLRIGPWFVLQSRNPAAPGMKYETLVTFVRKGRVKAQSIVRGPTTHQLWRFASSVKGLSREFGVCYSCGNPVTLEQSVCPHCNRQQTLPANPDVFLENQEQESAGPVNDDATPLVAEDISGPRITLNARGEATTGNGQSQPFTGQYDPRPKKGDGFLTTADLANAFKLEVDQKGRRKNQKKSMVSPIGADVEQYSTNRPRRRRHWFRWMALLLLLAGIAAVAYQYNRDPVFRDRVTGQLDWTIAWLKQHAELQKPAAPPHRPGDDDKAISPQDLVADHTGSAATQPAGTSPNPWDKLYSQPSNDKTAKTPTGSKEDRNASINEVRTLYRAAIDAEANGDFPTAVKKYQEIKNYPVELWPGDLELRLKLARQVSH